MVAEPDETVKLVLTVCPLVVRLTVRVPMVAVPAMVMFTVASVASETLTELTVMPEPKLAVVTLLTKLVKAAAMVTVRV